MTHWENVKRGELRLSHSKLKLLRPELYGFKGMINRFKIWRGGFDDFFYIKDQLRRGVDDPAVVICTDPLLVAAYSSDLDSVALMICHDFLVHQYCLVVGARLLTCNFYRSMEQFDSDLIIGPRAHGPRTGFNPLIVDFVSDDVTLVHDRKQRINEELWCRTYDMGVYYMQTKPGIARRGAPLFSLLEAIKRY